MVRLVDAAPEQAALLLERFDLARPLSEEPMDVGVATAGDLIRLLAVEAEPMHGLPLVSEWAGPSAGVCTTPGTRPGGRSSAGWSTRRSSGPSSSPARPSGGW